MTTPLTSRASSSRWEYLTGKYVKELQSIANNEVPLHKEVIPSSAQVPEQRQTIQSSPHIPTSRGQQHITFGRERRFSAKNIAHNTKFSDNLTRAPVQPTITSQPMYPPNPPKSINSKRFAPTRRRLITIAEPLQEEIKPEMPWLSHMQPNITHPCLKDTSCDFPVTWRPIVAIAQKLEDFMLISIGNEKKIAKTFKHEVENENIRCVRVRQTYPEMEVAFQDLGIFVSSDELLLLCGDISPYWLTYSQLLSRVQDVLYKGFDLGRPDFFRPEPYGRKLGSGPASSINEFKPQFLFHVEKDSLFGIWDTYLQHPFPHMVIDIEPEQEITLNDELPMLDQPHTPPPVYTEKVMNLHVSSLDNVNVWGTRWLRKTVGNSRPSKKGGADFKRLMEGGGAARSIITQEI